jgi:murein DD-endopeptidase MepM/ murein hydrolase activator NlpD
MDLTYYTDTYKLQIPVAKGTMVWNGKPNPWSNLPEFNVYMSQRFGQNMVDYAQFGMKGHNGIDIAGTLGVAVAVAPIKMWISQVMNDPTGYGNHVWAETESHTLNGENFKLELCFGHFSKILVQPYHWIEAGTPVGIFGSTGFSTGPHLHFGTRPWLRIGADWMQYAKDNGFLGWIDPEQFLPHIVWDYSELLNNNNPMEDINKFLNEHNLKLIRNQETGEFGWIYAGKVRLTSRADRATLMLYAKIHRDQNSPNITGEFWDQLPKEKF